MLSGSCTKFIFIKFVKSSLWLPPYSQNTNAEYLQLSSLKKEFYKLHKHAKWKALTIT